MYVYVRNNPVNGIDREGYSTELMEEPSLDTSEVNYKQLDNIKALDSGEPVIKDRVMYIYMDGGV